jgi:LmbE family N-acetylglucosaminyl deacetylase
VKPELLVNTISVHEQKLAALACHESQQAWLDASQGMNSYLTAADAESRTVARLGKRLTHAEGWTRHSHLGFCGEADDPLREALDGTLVSAPKSAR